MSRAKASRSPRRGSRSAGPSSSRPPGATSVALAVYLFGFAGAVLLLAALSMMGKPFFSLLLSVAAARMISSGLYNAGAGKTLFEVSGGFGIALTVLAFYGGVALALEDAHQRELLPLLRRGVAAESFEGFEDQLERLEPEPGVRHRL